MGKYGKTQWQQAKFEDMVLAVIKIADYKGADGDMKGNSKKGVTYHVG